MAFVALITGASSGLGEATARRLAREPDARLILVARREDRLKTLAAELETRSATGMAGAGGTTVRTIAADLTEADAPGRIRAILEEEYGELHLLVNNAGASWRGTFADTGWANVERHMQLNFEAPLRLIEALLPMLRATAASIRPAGVNGYRRPVSIVNVASTAGRVSRPGAGAYSASKFALAGWTDALHGEEAAHGVHVGLVLPGFVPTEGFPAAELKAKPHTRLILGTPEGVADAIFEAGPGGKAERYTPRAYCIAAALRVLLPGVVRKATAGGAFTTATKRQDS